MKNNKDYNPLEKGRNDNLRVMLFDIMGVLMSVGFDINECNFEKATICGIEIDECDFNPFFIIDNKKVFYQRELVWTTKDKQLFIESIYNGLDLGKFIIRNRRYELVKKLTLSKHKIGYKDVVDGKQRLNALTDFLQNKFTDLNGNYWSDFSEKARRMFLGYNKLSYCEMNNATDQEVKNTFLNVNFTGVQMSQEHLDFVKNINIK
jgi:hypothetical protein